MSKLGRRSDIMGTVARFSIQTRRVVAMKCHFATPSRTIFALPYWIADWKGYFADEGIEPQLAIGGSGDEIKAALRSGEILMSIDPPDGVLIDVSNGGPLRMLAGNACKPPLFIVAQPEIKTLADLRGKTFGVLSRREGSSKFIPLLAGAGGLSADDYIIVEVGGAPARARLLEERAIDVGLQPMPLNYEARAKGFSDLGWTGIFEPYYQFTTVNADIERVGRDPGLAVAALRALLRGQRAALADPKGCAAALAEKLGTEERYAAVSIREASELGILDTELGLSELGLARIADHLRESGHIHHSVVLGVAQCAALDFLARARASVDQNHERAR